MLLTDGTCLLSGACSGLDSPEFAALRGSAETPQRGTRGLCRLLSQAEQQILPVFGRVHVTAFVNKNGFLSLIP